MILTYLLCTFNSRLLEREDILLSPMKKAHIQTENLKNSDKTQNATEDFNYTTIAVRLSEVSWSNDSHPIGVVKSI